MLLTEYLEHCTLITRKSLSLARTAFFITTVCLAGCDALFIKRVELQRPNDPFQAKTYETKKTTIISTIDRIAADNNLSCRTRQGVARYCSKPPRTLVAFEDKHGFAICLFVLGTNWEKSKFTRLAETLEGALISSLPDTNLSVSLPDELPECIIPPDVSQRIVQ